MYVCMYVCMHVCICMNVSINRSNKINKTTRNKQSTNQLIKQPTKQLIKRNETQTETHTKNKHKTQKYKTQNTKHKKTQNTKQNIKQSIGCTVGKTNKYSPRRSVSVQTTAKIHSGTSFSTNRNQSHPMEQTYALCIHDNRPSFTNISFDFNANSNVYIGFDATGTKETVTVGIVCESD